MGRRRSRDFDFVVGHPRGDPGRAIDVFYDRGFELASRVDENGDVTATIDDIAFLEARRAKR